jgi:hypothetical protein
MRLKSHGTLDAADREAVFFLYRGVMVEKLL